MNGHDHRSALATLGLLTLPVLCCGLLARSWSSSRDGLRSHFEAVRDPSRLFGSLGRFGDALLDRSARRGPEAASLGMG